MAEDIIAIALEGDIRLVLAYPQVECIMQKEIRQQRADNLYIGRYGTNLF
jgi:hypothetical protein